MTRSFRLALSLSALLMPLLVLAGPGSSNQAAAGRLAAETGNTAKVSFNRATGAANFVRLTPGSVRVAGVTDESRARDFFRQHGELFGIADDAHELVSIGTKSDRLGNRSVGFHQVFNGIRVFGAELRAHFNAAGELITTNGTFIPNIVVATTPLYRLDALKEAAVAEIAEQFPQATDLVAGSHALYVYRQGLLQGIEGRDHLVYEIEVTNGSSVRELVYIDATNRKLVNQITGIHDARNRRAFDAQGATAPGPNYPATPFWVEGQTPFPTGTVEADNMIFASGETYDFFFNAFGRDSFDGTGGTMDAIFNRGNGCPNASWNGTFISFCPGLTSDDVTAHEWGHAYTQYTHNLIYQWQSGALNESYSDIWGETVDFINGRGTDSPNVVRTVDACSTIAGSPPPTLIIAGGSAAGSYAAKASVNEPPLPLTVPPTEMALSVPAGACTAVSGVSGKVAIIDWTFLPDGTTNECGSVTRANNAFAAGATAIIFVAPPAGLLNLSSSASIASVQVSNADGATIKTGLAGATATFTLNVGTDNSLRWLVGEDAGGALRDMWNPRCLGNPGKVTDTAEYVCSTADQGGVHSNSGVPNHEFALLVDGGSFNGQTIAPIGLTKATNIFFRAMTTYQVLTSDFANHADAMDASCDDLRVAGTNLPDLVTGAPSGQVVSAADCTQVANAALATELRTPPTFCNFVPLLAPSAPPAMCAAPLLQETFEANPVPAWTLTNQGVFPSYTSRDWAWTSNVPTGGTGMAMFGVDGANIGDCGADEQSGVMHLDSPLLTIPAGGIDPSVVFDHYVATEVGFDGGNVKISVNGGAFQTINAADFHFNAYNAVLTAAPGNTNPLAGQPGFSGTDGGSVSGSWGQSQVLLRNYAGPGDQIRIRFSFGVDGCGGIDGWYLDNVSVCPSLFTIFRNGFE